MGGDAQGMPGHAQSVRGHAQRMRVQANAEGGGTGGRRSMFDQGIEEEAEEDELDDDGPGGEGEETVRATPSMVRMNTMANIKVSTRAQEERKPPAAAGGQSMRVVGNKVAKVTALMSPTKSNGSASEAAAGSIVDDPDVEDIE